MLSQQKDVLIISLLKKSMILRSAALLFTALTLANCCTSGSGCAPEAGVPTAWDGLGPAPAGDSLPASTSPKRSARAKREIIVGPLDSVPAERNSKTAAKDAYEQQQTADQADENRLKRKLTICRTCLTHEAAPDDAVSR
jgi:hypothetical protein